MEQQGYAYVVIDGERSYFKHRGFGVTTSKDEAVLLTRSQFDSLLKKRREYTNLPLEFEPKATENYDG